MDKLKKIFKKDEEGAPQQSSPGQSQPSAGGAGGDATSANKVVLHTNVGDIGIQLYSDQTPKVRSSKLFYYIQACTNKKLDLQKLRHPRQNRQI